MMRRSTTIRLKLTMIRMPRMTKREMIGQAYLTMKMLVQPRSKRRQVMLHRKDQVVGEEKIDLHEHMSLAWLRLPRYLNQSLRS